MELMELAFEPTGECVGGCIPTKGDKYTAAQIGADPMVVHKFTDLHMASLVTVLSEPI